MILQLPYYSQMFLILLLFDIKPNIVGSKHFNKRKFRLQKNGDISIPSYDVSIRNTSNEKNNEQNIKDESFPKIEKNTNMLKIDDNLEEADDDALYKNNAVENNSMEYHPIQHPRHYENQNNYQKKIEPFEEMPIVQLKKNYKNFKNIEQKNKNSMVPYFINEDATNTDIFLQSFNIKQKKENQKLNNEYLENSNLELSNKMQHQMKNTAKMNLKYKTNLNPTLNLIAARAVDGLMGGINQSLQGPLPLDSNGNNSPLSNPIVTPNLLPNINTMPNATATNMPSIPQQTVSPTSPPTPPSPSPSPSPPPSSNMPMKAGVQNIASLSSPPQIPMASQMNVNNLPPMGISNNPAFNIHPTGANMRDNPSNVTSSEIVSITIGIVLSLFFFCFIAGCLVKMCKPKKRRRR